MMQMDSGGGPFPNDGLHQLFRHYPMRWLATEGNGYRRVDIKD